MRGDGIPGARVNRRLARRHGAYRLGECDTPRVESDKDTIPVGAESADEASTTASARRWWVRGVLGALVVLALIALGLLVSAWRHPSAFPEAGGWGVGTRHQKINNRKSTR